MSVVTFRKALQSEVTDFVKNVKDNDDRVFLQDTIPTIVSQLLFYREEGKFLYPEVYLIKDSSAIQGLPFLQKQMISRGEENAETVCKAIKKCAPLCENSWSIYLLVSEGTIEYGLFSGGESLTSVHREDILLNDSPNAQSVVCVRVLRDKLISVRKNDNSLQVYFDITDERDVEPFDESQQRFIRKTISALDETELEPQTNFLRRLFTHVFRYGHGTLACVVDKDAKVESIFTDGIILTEPIDFVKILDPKSRESFPKQMGLYELLSGMLQSDGITVFTDDGKVLAYNVFIKLSEQKEGKKTMGGARSRAFESLGAINSVSAAYMQSQDGKVTVYERGK